MKYLNKCADKQEFVLPFNGFNDTLLGTEPDAILEADIGGNPDLSDDDIDKLWDLHIEGMNWSTYEQEIAYEYATWLVGNLLSRLNSLSPHLDKTLNSMTVKVISPHEYNFETDIIKVEIKEVIPRLDVLETKYAGITADVANRIEYLYTTRDGFISFIDPKPNINDIDLYETPAYLTAVVECLAWRVFDIQRTAELENLFIEHACNEGILSEAAFNAQVNSEQIDAILNT